MSTKSGSGTKSGSRIYGFHWKGTDGRKQEIALKSSFKNRVFVFHSGKNEVKNWFLWEGDNEVYIHVCVHQLNINGSSYKLFINYY